MGIFKNTKEKALNALTRVNKQLKPSTHTSPFTPALNNITGTSRKITEDDPRWNPKTMGNKQGTLDKQKNAIQQYGNKNYNPTRNNKSVFKNK